MATATPAVTNCRVLIVDRSSDNREVLRTVLQRHGCEIMEADTDTVGLRLAKVFHPSVFVLDLDTVDPNDTSVCDGYDTQARAENASVLLLGRLAGDHSRLRSADVMAKPYHYEPLIRKIEELLRAADDSR